MRNEQNAVLASLRRAQQFLDTHADLLSPVNSSTRTQLDDVVTQLATLAITQDGSSRGSKGETARQHALQLALRRNYMTPVAELAKLRLRDVPEFAALTLPSADVNPQRVVAAAYAMADAAGAHAQVLVDNGLPATFADDLRAAATALSQSVLERSRYQGSRVGATAGLIAGEKHGRSLLKVLNALVMVHVGNDAQVIAEWSVAKAVRRKPGPAAGSRATGVTPIQPAVLVPASPAPTPIATPMATPVAVAA